MKLRIAAGVLVTILHFAFTVYAYGQADVIEPDEGSRAWASATKVLAVPVLYTFVVAETKVAIPRYAGLDWLPFVMLLNSLFWGFVVVAAIVWAKKRFARRENSRRDPLNS